MTESVWRPISTAPRNGSKILLFDPGDDDGDCIKVGHFVLPVYRTQGQGGWRINGGQWLALDTPTHWMPPPRDPPDETE